MQFLKRRWFLIALTLLLCIGFSFPGALMPFASAIPRRAVVAAVMFAMALPLDIRTMWGVIRRPGPAMIAVGINLGLLPPVAWAVSKLLPGELGTGLAIMGTIPCTIASAAVWTRRAGGNDAVAILVTMITNTLCFLVTPFWLWVLVQTDVQLDTSSLIRRLFVLVVLPIVAAQLLRRVHRVADWASRCKAPLGTFGQCGILVMIFVGAVESGVRGGLQGSIGAHDWVLMIVCVLAVHLSMLWVGCRLARLLNMTEADQIAVGFASSQKTLLVGLDIGLKYFGSLSILPMVAYHVGQLIADTFVADRWRE